MTATQASGALDRALAFVPTRRHEDWRHCDLRAALRSLSAEPAPDSVPPTEEGWQAQDAQDEAEGAAPCARWNRGETSKTWTRHIEGETTLRLDSRVASEGIARHPRARLVVAPGARLTLMDTFHAAADAGGLCNSVLNLDIGEGAQVKHHRYHQGGGLLYTQTLCVRLDAAARYDTTLAARGGRLARLESRIVLAGQGAQVRAQAAARLVDRNHADIAYYIEHQAARTVSDVIVRVVAEDSAHGSAQARASVAQDCPDYEVGQSLKGVLESERARLAMRPALNIDCDQAVRCTHGGAIGSLDLAALAYLRARGLGKAEARALLVAGFLAAGLGGAPDGWEWLAR